MLTLTTLALVAFHGSAAAPVNASELVGSWHLLRWTQIDESGTSTQPFTDRAIGRISYDGGGWVNVILMHPDWQRNGTPGGFIAYGGRFVVEDGAVRHIVDAASMREMIGTTQTRQASISGGILRLEASTGGDHPVRHILEWARSGEASRQVRTPMGR